MLRLENVSKYYYSSSNVTCALRKINLKFDIGEFVAITGESGSGKTTLLNVLSGLDSFEDGEMYYYDRQTSYFDESDWEQYRKNEIAFVFQSANLIDSYTVLENVMVTYVIEGASLKVAREKAKQVLKQVGLENDMHKKTSKLSGGQKQRVSIARALAKETNIIVADEPTGNLDTENSVTVLEILKKISKEKLVIVVSHNISEIEPYITRKIRLRDGEVVSDEEIEKVDEITPTYVEKHENENKQVFNMLYLNIKSQPKKSLLLLLLITMCVFASFIFLANFKMNLDDEKTKNTDKSFFENLDDRRLLVTRQDGSTITDEMLQAINHKYITQIEKYDYITDINYLRPGDYKQIIAGSATYDPNTGIAGFIDSSSIIPVNDDKFMRSGESLTSDMLRVGNLPTNDLEMVVYSEDDSLLNTEEIVLFRNTRLWGIDTWYIYKVKIVGILKEPTKEAFFSTDLCKMLELTQKPINFRFEYTVKERYYYRTRYLNYDKIVIDHDLLNNQLSFPAPALSQMENYVSPSKNNTTLVLPESTISGLYSFDFNNKLLVTDMAVGVSKELFEKVYQAYDDKKQIAIYISDYAYVNEVQDYLFEQGYDSLSCYRASVTGYNNQKVILRFVNLFVSVIAIIIVNLIGLLLGYTLLKVKKNDYIIFKMIGLKDKLSRRITGLELLFYGLIANIILIVTTIIVKYTTHNVLLLDLFKYLKFYDYFIILGICGITMILLARLFGKFIKNKVKITMLKEE